MIEAFWIACSGRFPMAFDENFHFGIIKLYAHHLSPFWSVQPTGLDVFGAVVRDTSYLYHWLLSFPYRLISAGTSNQTAAIMALRAVNIALFTSALPLYRILLLKTGSSRALVHSCLALFVLIPIAPLLAAQINYDNLFLPLTALVLLAAVNFAGEMKRTRRFNLRPFLSLVILMMITCLVKYAFLPIALGIMAFLAVMCYRTYPSWPKLALSISFGFTLMTRRTRWVLLVVLLIVSCLFIERYGINLVRYHKPVPDCSQVLSSQRCQAYGPWIRDHILEAAKDKNPTASSSSPVVYTSDWFYGMWLRTFFAVDGPASNFTTRGPFVLPAVGAIIFALIGLLAAIRYARQLYGQYDPLVLELFISVIMVYALALWFDGYQSFLQTGQAVAINGRYLLPVMPLMILVCTLGINRLLKGRSDLKLAVAALALVCMLWGGGALTYVLRSDDSWYWRNQAVYDTNHAVQRVLGPVTPGYGHPTAFMGWN